MLLGENGSGGSKSRVCSSQKVTVFTLCGLEWASSDFNTDAGCGLTSPLSITKSNIDCGSLKAGIGSNSWRISEAGASFNK